MADEPLAALRRLTPTREPDEVCDLCGTPIPDEHRHVFDFHAGAVACACQACSLLFEGKASARHRLIPNRVLRLSDFQLDDEQWDEFQVPVNLAMFVHSSSAGRLKALYPSPAGAMESALSLEAWRDLEAANPVLRTLEPDVEALLVNRVGEARDHLVVGIDECYRLVGLVRSGWRGLSGGSEVWKTIAAFFDDLRRRARVVGDGG
jgi:hypothetical protein